MSEYNRKDRIEEELEDLKKDLEFFQQEKERVRNIVGQIGGIPKFHTRIINVIFAIILMVSIVVSIIGGDKWRPIMIELTVMLLSAKILYMIHCNMKVNHFKLWVLSSIEWRLNEMMKHIRKLQD
jgi:hypothetical protein